MDAKVALAILAVALLGAGVAFAQSQQNTANAQQPKYQDTTEHAQFVSAIENGDFAAAKQLHDTYGFGGRVFGLLNETTFAQYSQLYKLEQQAGAIRSSLATELGFPGKGMMMGRGLGKGFGMGRMRGFGMMRGGWEPEGANETGWQ